MSDSSNLADQIRRVAALPMTRAATTARHEFMAVQTDDRFAALLSKLDDAATKGSAKKMLSSADVFSRAMSGRR